MMTDSGEVVYFGSPAEFSSWLEANGQSEDVLWVGYYKKATGKPSLTWDESVDEALCHGWIDGLRKSVDEERYRIRFTPRRKNSNWSAKNIKRVGELKRMGRMRPAGLEAFRKRKPPLPGQSPEIPELDPQCLKQFQRDQAAWRFFQSLSPSAKRLSIRWVMSAKREETRIKRLDALILSSAEGEKIPPLRRQGISPDSSLTR